MADQKNDMSQTFDVVIVGGGNAGCVLAARLSEVPELKVLLLEAGADHSANPAVAVPAGGKALLADSAINRDYKTLPQEGYQARSIIHPRGKGLGGTTLLNLNAIVFPDKNSIDNFEALGNPGWAYRDLQPYYRKFHTFHEPDAARVEELALKHLDPNAHGTSGPIQVTYGNYSGPFDHAWPRTFEALGKACKDDQLSGNAVGGLIMPGSINPSDSTRCHAALAYLTPEVRRRPNLEIISEAVVEKVLLTETEPNKAQGVQYIKNGHSVVVHANREVVLCGGVFNSPQLLELSGIGSREVIQTLGVRQLVDLPGVGENLQDHNVVGVSFESAIPTFDSFRDPAKIGAALQEYQQSQSGPLTSSVFMMGFLPCSAILSDTGKAEIKAILDQAIDDAESPQLRKQYTLIRRGVEDPKQTSAQIMCGPAQFNQSPIPSSAPVTDQDGLADYFTLFASISHPFSRGSCHAASADINAAPAIDPKYFSHPADVELMARHLQFLDTLVTTKPLADLAKPGGRTIPSGLDLKSLDYTRELLRTGSTTYHPCGTCAMMPRDDGGVVDPKLRVYGVEGLRVVDASIFPLVPRGNIQSSVYAVAERAADLIKEDLKL